MHALTTWFEGAIGGQWKRYKFGERWIWVSNPPPLHPISTVSAQRRRDIGPFAQAARGGVQHGLVREDAEMSDDVSHVDNGPTIEWVESPSVPIAFEGFVYVAEVAIRFGETSSRRSCSTAQSSRTGHSKLGPICG